jgi:peptidoglycan/LPS O-acetylase OafA/YrhL
MNDGSATGPRYLSLDHWRGFAALWVLVFHAHRGRPPLEPAWLGDFVSWGWLGVPLFFVISGYCIAERVARETKQGRSTLRFVLDRLWRLFPPYWAALALALLLNIAGALVKGVPLTAPDVLPEGWGWLAAAFAIEPWAGLPSFLLVAWTLSYELGFYLVAAGCLALVLRFRRPEPGLLLGAALLILGLLPAGGAWLPLLMLLPQFALGAIVWLLGRWTVSTTVRLLLGTLIIGIIGLCALVQPDDTGMPLRFACGAAWLLLALRPWDASIARFGGLRWLGWIGTFSYSLYLVHVPIVGKLGNLLDRWPPAAQQPLLVLLFSCLLTLPCAWLFYRAIEVNSETLRRNHGRPAPATHS